MNSTLSKVTLFSVNSMVTSQSNLLEWTTRYISYLQIHLLFPKPVAVAICYLCWKPTTSNHILLFLFPTVCTFKPESNWLQQINFCIFRCLIKTCYCNLKNYRETTTKKSKNYVNFMKNKILQASRNCHRLLKITGNFKAQLTATECSHFWVISDVAILQRWW